MKIKILLLFICVLFFTSCIDNNKTDDIDENQTINSFEENETILITEQVLMYEENNLIPKKLYTIPIIPSF